MTRTMFQGLAQRLSWLSAPVRVTPPPSQGRLLTLEHLETRDCPATIFWNASGGSGNVTDSTNWLGGVVPGAGDDVIFPAIYAGTVNNNVAKDSITVWNSMTVLGKNYTFTGSTYYLGEPGIRVNYATGKTTFTTGINFFFADNAKVTVDQQNSELIFGTSKTGITGAHDTLTFDGAGKITFNNRINRWTDNFTDPMNPAFSDTAVIKQGTGTLTFQGTNDNTYFGRTTVANGTLVLNGTAGKNMIPGELQIGDSIGTAGSAVVLQQKNNQIVIGASVTMFGDGLWDLTSGTFTETLSGLRANNSGAELRLGTSSITVNPGAPAVFLGSVNGTTGSITIGSGDQTFGGPINTGGNITASGGSIVEVQNVSTANLATTSNAKSETLYSSSTSNSITIQANDDFIPAYRDSDGVAQPAVADTNTLTLNSTSRTTILINSETQNGQVIVRNSVGGTSLGTLKIILSDTYSPNSGESFTLIDYRGVGAFPLTFAGLPEGTLVYDSLLNVEFKISYVGGDGNDVVLTNTNPQRVTLNQASVQADPTTGNVAIFDAVFTGAVKTFDPSKIATNFTGTLKSTGITFIQRSPNTYRIFVNGLTGSGTVTMNLLAGAGLSFANVASLPSTSVDNSVTVVVAPTGGGGGGGGGGGVIGPIGPGTGATNPGSGNVLLVGTGAGDNRINAYRGASTNFTQSRVTGPEFSGGVRVATADFNGDGFADYVLGSGPGGTSTVRILDGRTGATLFNATPFELSFTGGVYVAAGDLNGDKIADLVVTADVGGGPRVLVYSGVGFKLVGDFYGIDDPNFRGGARPAIGDIDGDGIGDLVIAAGFGGGPRIAGYFGPSVFGSTPTKLFQDFYAFEPTLTNGVFVTVGDINGDGFGDIIAGGGPGGGPRVTGFSGEQLLKGVRTTIANFFAGDPNNRGGIRLTVEDFQGDGIDDLITGSGDGAGTTVTVYPLNTLGSSGTPPVLTAFDAFPDLLNGVFVG